MIFSSEPKWRKRRNTIQTRALLLMQVGFQGHVTKMATIPIYGKKPNYFVQWLYLLTHRWAIVALGLLVVHAAILIISKVQNSLLAVNRSYSCFAIGGALKHFKIVFLGKNITVWTNRKTSQFWNEALNIRNSIVKVQQTTRRLKHLP